MLEALLAQFGIGPEEIARFKTMIGQAGQKIDSFDARLTELKAQLDRIEAALPKKKG